MNKKTVMIILAVAVAVAISGVITFKCISDKGNAKSDAALNVAANAEYGSEDEGEKPLSQRQIYFSGFSDCTVNPGQKILLENMEENKDFLIKYQILENDELKYETDLIPAGAHVGWIPSENLEPGSHEITIRQLPFMKAEVTETGYLELTSGDNEIQIEVKE